MVINNKGRVFVSALLYLALGLVIITLILAVATPLINKVRDMNTYLLTQQLMINLDKNIQSVSNEGPGSRRFLSPFVISKGELNVDTIEEKVIWSFETNSKLVEPGVEFEEGPVTIMLTEGTVKGEYLMTLTMDYVDIADLDMASSVLSSPLKGSFSLKFQTFLLELLCRI